VQFPLAHLAVVHECAPFLVGRPCHAR
jgi:hypothetical protein